MYLNPTRCVYLSPKRFVYLNPNVSALKSKTMYVQTKKNKKVRKHVQQAGCAGVQKQIVRVDCRNVIRGGMFMTSGVYVYRIYEYACVCVCVCVCLCVCLV